MKVRLLLAVLLVAYAVIVVPFAEHLRNRPLAIKLGYLPEAEALKLVAADHRALVAEYSVVRVLFYFGALLERFKNNITGQPEYFTMYRTVETAVKLDPYNEDAYYFAQAAFTWEVGRFREVNRLLEHGMRYRTWDWQLPFFVGFNNAYFLRDYPKAAEYMQKAATLSGEPLLVNLSARYFYEAGTNELGIVFLDVMEKQAKDAKTKKAYAIRREALLGVKTLEKAAAVYRSRYGRLPSTLEQIIGAGIIEAVPADPYGGSFYITGDGMIRSTSKFAFGGRGK